MITIYNARDIVENQSKIIDYFWTNWGNQTNYMFYKDCIERSITTNNDLPRFFVAIENSNIIGCYAILRSDLNSRQDLFPWFACLYVEEDYRGRQIGELLQNHAKQYVKTLGYQKLYLCTEINNYYEKNNWKEIGIGYSISDDKYKIYETECV